MNPHQNDSIQSKMPKSHFNTVPRSIDDMMKMMQRHMLEMEEMQQRFFHEQNKRKNVPKLQEM
jgi:hypothetical protein